MSGERLVILFMIRKPFVFSSFIMLTISFSGSFCGAGWLQDKGLVAG